MSMMMYNFMIGPQWHSLHAVDENHALLQLKNNPELKPIFDTLVTEVGDLENANENFITVLNNLDEERKIRLAKILIIVDGEHRRLFPEPITMNC